MATKNSKNNRSNVLNSITQSLASLFSGVGRKTREYNSYSNIKYRLNSNGRPPTFEEWLDFEKHNIVRSYAKDYHTFIEKQNTYLTASQKCKKIIENHFLGEISYSLLVDLYSKYYNKDLGYGAHRNYIIILNVIKKLEKVADVKFNQYVIKSVCNMENNARFATPFELVMKKLEKLTFSVELERQLANKKEQEKSKRIKV